VDPLKEANAATERLVNGTSTLRDECAALGHDWEETFDQRRRERDRADENGLEMAGRRSSMRRQPVMDDLARAVRAGVPIAVAEARALGLGLPEDPPGDSALLRFNDQDILAYHIESGILTINEARARLNLSSVDWGDVPVRRQGIEAVDTAGGSLEDDDEGTEIEVEDDDDERGLAAGLARRNGDGRRVVR